jgi:PAS domain S-box-containing protein
MNRYGTSEADGGEWSFLPARTAAAAVDEHGTISAWSRGARHLLGYETDEVVGRPAAELLSAPLPSPARHHLAGQQPWTGRVALRDRNGHRLDAALHAVPLSDAQGRIQWYLETGVPEEEHDSASLALQRHLLQHQPPTQLAVETASRYLPADLHGDVGGDWFDVIPLSGSRVALVVGDVVGHGLTASATMGQLRMAVRTLADVDLPPDELLAQLDDLVLEEIEEGIESGAEFGATCLYAVYDPVSLHCVLASAGHPAPVAVAPDGSARFIDLNPGPPLGVGGLPFEATDVLLADGSLLALYTDGLIENRDRDMDSGMRILLRASGGVRRSPQAVCDRIVTALRPDRAQDDVALLVARIRALGDANVASRHLSPDPAVVADARRWAARQLDRWDLQEAVPATELIISELVTNAIRYAAPPIQLRLIHNSSLICEVSDGSSTAPHPRRARALDEGGRGLFLVGQLTTRWGTRHTPTGKTIWAEQATRSDLRSVRRPHRSSAGGHWADAQHDLGLVG